MHEENKSISNGYKYVWEKMRIHYDNEIMYVFTPIEHNYNNNLKKILFWTSFGEKKENMGK
jgi:hypothetical protein